MKNRKILLLALASLGVCYAIGQYRVLSKSESNTEETELSAESTGDTAASLENVTFEGVAETSDTPWNVNAGIINMEDAGDCIFLTPNTSAIVSEISSYDTLELSYEIHPWVSGASDGAGIILWLLDADDTILWQEEISIDAAEGWTDFAVNVAEYDTVDRLQILCNNGGNDDDSGDWVVIRVSVLAN